MCVPYDEFRDLPSTWPIGIPELTLDKNPTNNQKPTWTWDAIPSANDYELILDGVIIEHTYSSTSYQPSSDLSEGKHTLEVRARIGTNYSVPAYKTVTVDLTAPKAPNPKTQTPVMGYADVTWTWPPYFDHNGDYKVYVDTQGTTSSQPGTGDGDPSDGDYIDLPNGQRNFTVTGLDTGVYKIYVKASDAAGNYSSAGTHSVNVIPTPTPSYSKSISYSKSWSYSQSRSQSYTPSWMCRAYRYYATGADQKFIVPVGIKALFFQIWGAGGETGGTKHSAGSGGYTICAMNVTPGDEIMVGVGETGENGTPGYSRGTCSGGAGSGNAGAGGGLSAVYYKSISEDNLIAIGGGGGGAGSNNYRAGGGAGGGISAVTVNVIEMII